MIPCKKNAVILEHKMDKHEIKNNGQLKLKMVPLGTLKYREKLVERLSNGSDMLELPIFNGASADFVDL